MSLKSALKRRIMNHMFSPKRRAARRRKTERRRQRNKSPHTVHVFHDVSDPYSHLLIQLLPEFYARYSIDLEIHLVPPPPDWAAEERDKLEAYARRDAALLAQKAGLDYVDPGRQPAAPAITAANQALLEALQSGQFLEKAVAIGQGIWGLEQSTVSPAQPTTELANHLNASDTLRDTLGHYLGATLYYGGEWYWGPDRLHYLEARLTQLGARTETDKPAYLLSPPTLLKNPPRPTPTGTPELHWYLSFRSPYTAIVADRVRRLADAYGADLKLRYVLPMVMRGLQVPQKKGFYILSDVVREAEYRKIPFGDIVDPVGKPVERGYAILDQAIAQNKGYAFVDSFLSGVWAEGIDAGSDAGLKRITERAGLDWSDMRPHLNSNEWRSTAEDNRQEMLRLGLWGVPSFRVDDSAIWGQDRLWVIEDALLAKLAKENQE